MGTIRGTEGVYKGRQVLLPPGQIDVGRDAGNSMAFPSDPYLSRRHATLFFRNGTWFCRDLQSSNGTFVDSVRVGKDPVPILPGSTVSFGQQAFVIDYEVGLLARIVQKVLPAPVVTSPPRPIASPPPLKRATEQDTVGPTRLSAEGDCYWYGPNVKLLIHGYEIHCPMVYVGRKFVNTSNTYSGYGLEEPSLINPALKVASHGEVSDMSYYPTYKDMNPSQRAAYLNWLAQGRRSEIAQGYLFVFYYGLERRLSYKPGTLPGAEREALLAEIEALRKRYTQYESFQSYSSEFLAAYWPERPESINFGQRLRGDYEGPKHHGEIWAMACLAHNQMPLRQSHLEQWIDSQQRSLKRKAPAKRCWNELKELFLLRVGTALGDALPLETGKSKISQAIPYGNMSLRSHEGKSRPLPRVIGDTELVESWASAAANLLEELEPASKYLGTNPDDHDRARANLLYPYDLTMRSAFGKALLAELETFDSHADEVGVTELQVRLGLGEEPLKKLWNPFLEFCDALGYALEPDPRSDIFAALKPQSVCVGRVDAPTDTVFTEAFNRALLALMISGYVARGGGSAPVQLPESVQHALIQRFHLSPHQSARTSLFGRWVQRVCPRPTKAMIEGFPAQFRDGAAIAIVSAAKGSGPLSAKAITTLISVLKVWSWSESEVYSALYGTGDDLAVVKTDTAVKGFAIPPPDSAQGPTLINMEKVKARMEETIEVSRLLGNVFEEVEVPEAEASLRPTSAQYEPLLNALVAGGMSDEEFDALARDHGFLPSGALESLNDAAFDLTGGPLIEGGNPYYIDAFVLEEMRSERTENQTS